MSTTLKQWQARFVISLSSPNRYLPRQDICLYGTSTDKLQQAVSVYLREKKPVYFSNRGDYLIEHLEYFYSDGQNKFPPSSEGMILPEVCWLEHEPPPVNRISRYTTAPHPLQRLDSFDAAVEHFVTSALIIERGPEYQSKAIVQGDFRLPFLERVLRESEDHLVNNLIERGWHIIALEYKGELSMSGELMSREAIFVLGHSEARAAKVPLKAD